MYENSWQGGLQSRPGARFGARIETSEELNRRKIRRSRPGARFGARIET